MYIDLVVITQLRAALNSMQYSSASPELIEELAAFIEKATDEFVVNMEIKVH